MFNMTCREDIPEFLNSKNLIGYGAEVGVFRGDFSAEILKKWRGKKLYLIDSWRYFNNEVDISNVRWCGQVANFSDTLFQTYKYAEKSTIIRDLSLEAVRLFKDAFFDFVYLDAGHRFENVSADIREWYKKVKPGGYLMGHDYLDGTVLAGGLHPTLFEVKSAVDIFAFSNDLTVNVIPDLYPSWCIIKPPL